MVIIPSKKLIFIHMPRTGGTSLSLALTARFTDALWDNRLSFPPDIPAGMHCSARLAMEQYPGYQTFTILRDPVGVFRSHYGWLQRWSQASADDPGIQEWPAWFADWVYRTAQLSFEQVVQDAMKLRLLCNPGGFLQTYCHESTQVFRYSDCVHQEIATWLDVELPDITENESFQKPVARQPELMAIRQYCHADYMQLAATAGCVCEQPGWCERHQCHKTPHWHRLCQTRPDYYAMWEAGRGPGQVVPQPKMGLGDYVEKVLSSVGITEQRVTKLLGKPCGCGKRKQKLNKLGRKIGIG